MYSADKTSSSGGSATQDPWDQRLARLFVRPLARLRITPNQVTTASLLIGLTGGWLFIQGGAWVHWGAALFMLATFMDHLDGELARSTGQTSDFGAVFDQIAGGIYHVVLFCAIGIGLTDSMLGLWSIPLGLVAGLAVATTFTLRLVKERQQGADAVQQPSFAGFEVEDIMYIVGPVTWLGGLLPFLLLAAIGAPIFLIHQIIVLRRDDGARETAPGR